MGLGQDRTSSPRCLYGRSDGVLSLTRPMGPVARDVRSPGRAKPLRWAMDYSVKASRWHVEHLCENRAAGSKQQHSGCLERVVVEV